MKVLLTGGAGFIGAHIALLLLEKGYDVVILDSFANSSFNVIKAIKKLNMSVDTRKVTEEDTLETYTLGDK